MAFKVTTTGRKKARFTWSYSRLKNFEACPHKHNMVDLTKEFAEEESDQLRYGNAIHKAAEDRLGPKKVPLPTFAKKLAKYCDGLESTPGEIIPEIKAAFTDLIYPCDYFDDDVWYRGKIDVLKINGPVALVIDWKTGKIIEDSVQLALAAAWVFAKYPQIKRVRSEFVWLKFDARTHATFTPEDIGDLWSSLEPRIEAMRVAWETGVYPAKQGGLCRNYCPVETCKHYGG